MSKKYIKCAQCGKEIEKEKAITSTIDNYKMFGSGGKKMKFCSGKCAMHCQFAYEG